MARRPDPNAIAIDAFTMTWTNELFFISPFQPTLTHITESGGRQGNSNTNSSSMANTKLVAQPVTSSDGTVLQTSEHAKDTLSATQTREATSPKEDEPWFYENPVGSQLKTVQDAILNI